MVVCRTWYSYAVCWSGGSAEAWHFDWSSPDRLSSRMFHGWQWMDRKVHWDKPEASWSNVTSTECAGDSGDSCRICRPCLMSKHSCTVKKWTVRAMRVMIGKENIQNSQCKRVVSVSLLEGAILGLWQASLSQHGVWLFKFFRGSSESQKQRMLIPNLHTVTREQRSCCKCLLQKPSRCLIWMNWYQWNRSFSGKLCLLSKCEHLKSGRRFHSKVSFRYSLRLAFRKDFNKPVRGTKCIFWVNMKGAWLFFRGWLSKTHQ